ncbi:MAG: hypothetical protein ACTSXX_12330 [Candidatus Baldrarchaeia archaeon]
MVIFSTDEVDLLMRELRYVKVIRVEMPLPLRIEDIAQRQACQKRQGGHDCQRSTNEG